MIGLTQMVFNSIAKCDQDIRRELFNSIILTGGSSLFPQLTERLKKDLDEKVPQVKFQSSKQAIFVANSSIEKRITKLKSLLLHLHQKENSVVGLGEVFFHH